MAGSQSQGSQDQLTLISGATFPGSRGVKVPGTDVLDDAALQRQVVSACTPKFDVRKSIYQLETSPQLGVIN